MKEEQDPVRDIAEIRSMMERSSKFLSLSGQAGVMAGIYALAGAFVAYKVFDYEAQIALKNADGMFSPGLLKIIFLAITVLILTIGTAVLLSSRKAEKAGEKLWNTITRRVVINMMVPLAAGGLLVVVMISKGMLGFVAPFTLLFYGIALYNVSKFTYEDLRSLGLINIALGLIGTYFMEYGLLFWAFGFGVLHIVYGIIMHYRHER